LNTREQPGAGMLIQEGEKYPIAMKIDIGGKLYEAMKHLNVTKLDKKTFTSVVENWYH